MIHNIGNHYLTLSIVMTIVCFIFGWHSLFCTIPAIIFAISVSIVFKIRYNYFRDIYRLVMLKNLVIWKGLKLGLELL